MICGCQCLIVDNELRSVGVSVLLWTMSYDLWVSVSYCGQ